VGARAAVPTDEQVRQLVDEVCTSLASDVQTTFNKVDENPKIYRPDPKANLVIYEMNGTIAASPIPGAVRKNLVKKPDARGKLYRQEMVDMAAKIGTGTIEYADRDPRTPEGPIEDRVLYFKVAKGKDGKSYIVAFIKPKPAGVKVP
jgi:hypothetical protein